jgi:DNA-binding Lrp family transcriptional regulator
MAVKAYVLIEADPGASREVAVRAQKIDGVKSVSVVTGPHDVIAVVETADAKALGDLLITKLQKIEGIVSTITDVVVD